MSLTPQTIEHTRGSTFSWGGLVQLPAGTWSATCKVKSADGTTVETLTVTLEALAEPDADGNTHSILIEASSVQTADWAIAKLRCDVRYADNSDPPIVEHSPTFIINSVEEIT